MCGSTSSTTPSRRPPAAGRSRSGRRQSPHASSIAHPRERPADDSGREAEPSVEPVLHRGCSVNGGCCRNGSSPRNDRPIPDAVTDARATTLNAWALNSWSTTQAAKNTPAIGALNGMASDRRSYRIGLPQAGRELVAEVTGRRRAEFEQLLAAVPADRHQLVVTALQAVADAAGEPPESDLAVGLGS